MKLIGIKEDARRDYDLHFSGCVLYDNKYYRFIICNGYDGVNLHYLLDDGDNKSIKASPELFNKRFKGVLIEDGYFNCSRGALLLSREYERKYKKCSGTSNSSFKIAGEEYCMVNEIGVLNEISVNLFKAAISGGFVSYDEAIVKLVKDKKLPAIAISRDICIEKLATKNFFQISYFGRTAGFCRADGKAVIVVPELKEIAQERGIVNV